MSEPYLTMAEIKQRYPNEWVLIDDPKLSRVQEILGGRVVVHSPDRAEFDRLWDAWDSAGSTAIATWYTGRVPPSEVLPPEVTPEPGAA